MPAKKIIYPLIILTFIILLSGCTASKNTTTTPAKQEAETKTITEEKVLKEPKEVTKTFMLATLGTLPNAEIDYDKAKTLMTRQYKAEFVNPAFIPQAYGIQDGPDKVEFERQDIEGEKADVVYMGYWGEDLQMRWKFEMEKENGEWKIALINPGQ
jgi:hypothetical protein